MMRVSKKGGWLVRCLGEATAGGMWRLERAYSLWKAAGHATSKEELSEVWERVQEIFTLESDSDGQSISTSEYGLKFVKTKAI